MRGGELGYRSAGFIIDCAPLPAQFAATLPGGENRRESRHGDRPRGMTNKKGSRGCLS